MKLRQRKRPKQTQAQTNYNQLEEKVTKLSRDQRYKEALKEATLLVRKQKMGAGKAAAIVNAKYELTSKLSKKKVTKQTVLNYTNKGLVGTSPLKKGPRVHLPSSFTALVHTHAQMKQLEGVAEAKPRHLKALIGAAIRDTPYDNHSRDYLYIYRKFRREQCANAVPTKPIQRENRETADTSTRGQQGRVQRGGTMVPRGCATAWVRGRDRRPAGTAGH